MGAHDEWVRESRFGRWFLGTDIWREYVLEAALDDLLDLLAARDPRNARMLDLGCGEGVAFIPIAERFQPLEIVGIDIDPILTTKAKHESPPPGTTGHAEVVQGTALRLPFADSSFDLVLCHQLLHHVSAQKQVLNECRRVLSRGGMLLVAESCRSFIESTWVRWLFRHPADAQHTWQEFVALIRDAGFALSASDIRTLTPWWSRPDLGLASFFTATSTSEPTELLAVARAPEEGRA